MSVYGVSMRMIYILLLNLSVLLTGYSQQKCLVYFKDKGKYEALTFQKKYDIISEYLSDRAITRRSKHRSNTIDKKMVWQDLPLDEHYITSIEELGFKTHGRLRWFNVVSGYADEAIIIQISQLPFVHEVKPVVKWRFEKNFLDDTSNFQFPKSSSSSLTDFDYGPAWFQIQFHKIDKLHEQNINGEGVVVAVFDTGFRLTIPSLRHIHSQLIAEYDYVQMDSVTSNQVGDQSGQDFHGTLVLSVLGGYAPGELIGPAFGASYILAKTEVDSVEDVHLEEDNWAMAAEWVERLGADIVSSSVGYSIFSAGEFNYSYSNMDGKTTIVAQAANELARRGVLVTNSAGNEGDTPWKYIIAPADGVYVLSVGSLNNFNQVLGFSSRGPTYDGRFKPDVVALGQRVYGATVNNSYQYNDGTSMSCPLVSGIAAQLLQAYPHLNLLNLIDIIRRSGDNADYPNNNRGWGKVDAWEAWSIAGEEKYHLPDSYVVLPPKPNPYFRGNGIVFFRIAIPSAMKVNIKIFNILGEKVADFFFDGIQAQNLIPWNVRNMNGNPIPAGIYIYKITVPEWESTGKLTILN